VPLDTCKTNCDNDAKCLAYNEVRKGPWGNDTGCCTKTVASPLGDNPAVDIYVKQSVAKNVQSIVKGGLGGNTTENVTLAGGVSGIIGKSSGLENFALTLVTTDGSIYYADTNILSGTPNYTRVGGALTNVSYSKGKVMGVNSAGNIYYNENYRTGGWKDVAGGLTNVSLDSNTGVVMGVNSSGNIYYNDNYKSSNWVQIPGSLMNISYSNNQCYGVNSNQQIFYNPNYRSGGWIQIPGSLVQVNFNANDGVVVGVNSNEDIFISTKNITNTKNEWQHIPGKKLINVNYHNGQLMGVNNKGDILYKPDITIQDNWVDITDTLRGKNVRQISFGEGMYKADNSGATVYEHINFSGASSTKGPGDYNMNEMGIANDSISSVKVSPGYMFVGYQHASYQGDVVSTINNVPNLHNLNFGDSISSFKVIPIVSIYEDINYRGSMAVQGPGNYNITQMGVANDSISSVKVGPGLRFIGYEHSDYQGGVITIEGGNANLHEMGWGDKISSFKIVRV
jgi:hypothetical protein